MKRVLSMVLGLVALAIGVGCETGSSGGSSGGVPNVAGTWQLTDLTFGKNATIVLVQDNQILSGTVSNFKGRNGVIQGTLTSGGLIQMRFLFPRGQTDVTLQVNGNTMTGSWIDRRDGTTAQISGAKG